jgi:hypothetical protein
MARGWESKSVEAQIDAAEAYRSASSQRALSPEQLEAIRKKETLLLSRTRVAREIETSQNPRYQAVLEKALAELDAQLQSLADV